MWKTVAGIVLVVAVGQSQVLSDLLLPENRHIAGIVVDSEGAPISQVSIDHSNDHRQAHQTDSTGKFELDTRAPILVIRRAGYRSAVVHTQDVKELTVTLRKFDEKRLFPSCSKGGSYVGIGGRSDTFVFPRISDIHEGPQSQDIDYVARTYYIETTSGPKGIRHGTGPMWSSGMPSDEDVWRSVQYDENTYVLGDLPIIDARGQMADGARRYLGKFGESASYSGVDEASAKTLDKFLDGACANAKPVR